MTKEQALAALKEVKDPELGLDIVTLNFIRDLVAEESSGKIRLKMTLTTPLCPLKDDIVGAAKAALKAAGAKRVELHLEFDPPWEPTPEVQALLGR
jgi:metal-sulfur cluster biosynthetic enzyme